MKFGFRDEIYDKILEIKKKYSYSFIIFGSRARGDYRKNSDINIAIDGNVLENDRMRIRNDFDKINMEYKLDLVFICEITQKSFLDEIRKEGVMIQ